MVLLRFPPSRVLPLFVVALALPIHGLAAPSDIDNGAPCPGFQIVPGQGPSCPADGGWWVILGDGTRLFTHGPDPIPAFETLPPAPVADGTDPGPFCVTNPAEPHMLLVYSVPAGKTDRYLTMADRIRDMARQANAFLRAEAAQHDDTIDYRVKCDVLGNLEVAHEILATPASLDSFTTITTELRARGYTSPVAKYWIWHDDGVGGFGGQGNLAQSDAPSLLNKNNIGPSYAITYGYDSWYIMMHENGHNMGAVQNHAPESSFAGHCNDGRDVMCYADGGGRSDYYTRCWQLTFDCGDDTYFNPEPAQGSWLFDHWNLASPLNRYVQVEGACEPTAGVATDDPAFALAVVTLGPQCWGRYFLVTSARIDSIVTRDFAVCFHAGDDLLGCQDTPNLHEDGAVPEGATTAVVTYTGATGASPFLFMVN